jgi:hypothetical protein
LKVEGTGDTAGDADDELTTDEDEHEADGPVGLDDGDIEDGDIEDGDIEDIDDLEDLDGDEIDDGDLDDAVTDEADLALEPPVEVPVAKVQKAAEPAEADAEDDELLADEVEASLDVILAERLRGDDTEADEVDTDEEEDDGLPNQLATVIPVRQPDEFLCQSCFLLKPPGQLADADHQLCRDCA